jgi:type IV pilus assembly protein PilB
MQAHEEELAIFLLDAGLLSHAQLADVQARAQSTNETLARVLVLSGSLSEDEVRRTQAKVLGIPFVILELESILPEALTYIPEPFSRTHGVVAYALQKDKTAPGGAILEVALLDVAQHELLKQLPLPYRVRVRMTDRASMTRALLLYQKTVKDSFELEAGSTLPPMDLLLEQALSSLAESAHLIPKESGFIVQYRIAGVLYDAMTFSQSVGEEIIGRTRELAHISAETMRTSEEGSFKILTTTAEEVLVRIAILSTVSGETVRFSFTPMTSGRVGHTLESLGLHGAALEQLRGALQRRLGLVLVCGEAHSGKRTLLYTLLDVVGGYMCTTITLENTISAHLPFALQTEANTEGVSMGARIRAALLQNPDVLMISDISNRESALLAAEAANKGVFVIAGVESPSAARGVEKLLSLGISPSLLASTLSVSVATSLLRALCSACRNTAEPYKLSRTEMSSLEEEIDFSRVLATLKEEHLRTPDTLWRDISFFHPGEAQCDTCNEGYHNYLGIQEVLPNSLMIKEIIRTFDGASAQTLEATARQEGMLTRLEDAIYKAAEGETSIEEVLLLEA